jgi:hypothetical protein
MPKRVDDNQAIIVRALRSVGATVQSLADIGKGCPDLLVAFRGQCFVAEVKDGSKPPSRRKLTPDEENWHRLWAAPVYILNNIDDALNMLGLSRAQVEERKG